MTTTTTTTKDVFLFIPNLIGYVRVIFSITSLSLMIFMPEMWILGELYYTILDYLVLHYLVLLIHIRKVRSRPQLNFLGPFDIVYYVEGTDQIEFWSTMYFAKVLALCPSIRPYRSSS